MADKIRESVGCGMEANAEVLEARYSNTFTPDEQDAINELLSSVSLKAIIDSGYDRHDLRALMVTETTYSPGFCARLSEKIIRLVSEGVVNVDDFGKKSKTLAEGTAEPEGQDMAQTFPELAKAQPDTSTDADKGTTGSEGRGDKSDVDGHGEAGEPLAQVQRVVEPDPALKVESKESLPEDKIGKAVESWSKVDEGMNDEVDDKFGGQALQSALPGPDGALKTVEAKVNEDDVETPGENKDPEAKKADSEQSLDGIKPEGDAELNQGRADVSLESVDSEGITISERLAFALTEDAAAKFGIQEGSSAWGKLFKAALRRVRQYRS